MLFLNFFTVFSAEGAYISQINFLCCLPCFFTLAPLFWTTSSTHEELESCFLFNLWRLLEHGRGESINKKENSFNKKLQYIFWNPISSSRFKLLLLIICMMTKITDNGIRFIIMIPLIVQPISSVLQVTCFWIISFIHYRGGLSQKRNTAESRLLRLWCTSLVPIFSGILSSHIQDP